MNAIDWKLWAALDSAPLYQLAALLVGVDPAVVALRDVPGGWGAARVKYVGDINDSKRAEFERVMTLAAASLRVGSLKHHSPILSLDLPAGTKLRPAEFWQWAKSKGLPVPPKLSARTVEIPHVVSAPEDGVTYGGWQEIADALATRFNLKKVNIRTARTWLANSDVHVEKDGHAVFLRQRDLEKVRAPKK